VTATPDLLASGEGPAALPLPKTPPHIGPSGHVTGVPSNFEILATPLEGGQAPSQKLFEFSQTPKPENETKPTWVSPRSEDPGYAYI